MLATAVFPLRLSTSVSKDTFDLQPKLHASSLEGGSAYEQRVLKASLGRQFTSINHRPEWRRHRSGHNQNWSSQEVKQLKRLVKENTPTLVIGLKLERSEASIYGKAQREGISLRPTNQRPYHRMGR